MFYFPDTLAIVRIMFRILSKLLLRAARGAVSFSEAWKHWGDLKNDLLIPDHHVTGRANRSLFLRILLIFHLRVKEVWW